MLIISRCIPNVLQVHPYFLLLRSCCFIWVSTWFYAMQHWNLWNKIKFNGGRMFVHHFQKCDKCNTFHIIIESKFSFPNRKLTENVLSIYTFSYIFFRFWYEKSFKSIFVKIRRRDLFSLLYPQDKYLHTMLFVRFFFVLFWPCHYSTLVVLFLIWCQLFFGPVYFFHCQSFSSSRFFPSPSRPFPLSLLPIPFFAISFLSLNLPPPS